MCPHLRYGLSFRNLKELMAERDLNVDHVTILALGTALCTRAEPPRPRALMFTFLQHYVRPYGADHQWVKVPHQEFSVCLDS